MPDQAAIRQQNGGTQQRAPHGGAARESAQAADHSNRSGGGAPAGLEDQPRSVDQPAEDAALAEPAAAVGPGKDAVRADADLPAPDLSESAPESPDYRRAARSAAAVGGRKSGNH